MIRPSTKACSFFASSYSELFWALASSFVPAHVDQVVKLLLQARHSVLGEGNNLFGHLALL